MKLVIDIPDFIYNALKEDVDCGTVNLNQAIVNGTVLPKGYGRLLILSEDTVKREQMPLSFSCQKWISEVGLSNATVAIIKLDKEVG